MNNRVCSSPEYLDYSSNTVSDWLMSITFIAVLLLLPLLHCLLKPWAETLSLSKQPQDLFYLTRKARFSLITWIFFVRHFSFFFQLQAKFLLLGCFWWFLFLNDCTKKEPYQRRKQREGGHLHLFTSNTFSVKNLKGIFF